MLQTLLADSSLCQEDETDSARRSARVPLTLTAKCEFYTGTDLARKLRCTLSLGVISVDVRGLFPLENQLQIKDPAS